MRVIAAPHRKHADLVTIFLAEQRHRARGQTIARGGETLLDAEVRVAALKASTFTPVALPDALYQEFKALEPSPTE